MLCLVVWLVFLCVRKWYPVVVLYSKIRNYQEEQKQLAFFPISCLCLPKNLVHDHLLGWFDNEYFVRTHSIYLLNGSPYNLLRNAFGTLMCRNYET